MKKDKIYFDWENTGNGKLTRYIEKFPRRLIEKYPEGVHHESMRAVYKPFSYLTDCWEDRGWHAYYGQLRGTKRWIKSHKGEDLNKTYRAFMKRPLGRPGSIYSKNELFKTVFYKQSVKMSKYDKSVIELEEGLRLVIKIL